MTRPKKLLFICGSSVATSTLAEVKVKQVAKSRGVEIDTYKGKVMDAKNLILSIKPDIVIATAMSDGLRELTKSMSIKCFSGVPLITGVGQEELYELIFEAIKEME